MAKWYGRVGYVESKEIQPGVWDYEATEETKAGDLLSDNSRWSNSNKVNDDITMANRISFIADPSTPKRYSSIKYVEYMGTFWEVSAIDASQFPRLILTMGGVYNGKQAESAK